MKRHIFSCLMLLLTCVLSAVAQKVSILGDSYSTYRGYLVPDTNAVWYPFDGKHNDVKSVEQTWWHMLVKEMGWTLIRNNSYSGSTICYRGYDNEDYRLRSFENRCDDLGNPDVILIFGGTNDSWSGAKVGEYKYSDWDTRITPASQFGKGKEYPSGELYTYRPALAKMLDRMKRQYKNAVMFFILNSELRAEINESSYEICKHYDIPVITLHDIEKQYGHPSIKGMRAIADQVKEALVASKMIPNVQGAFKFGAATNPKGHTIHVDAHGFLMDGIPAIPVMGEIHYSRVPESEWRNEIRKMKAGGITIASTYIFWNHHEAVEGQWDWSGNRNLHRFLEVCKEENMPVVLRVGPFCHGEVWQGGMPDWIVGLSQTDKQYKLRSTGAGFLAAVKRLYSNIYAQSYDMMWKNGGTVIGMQIENECRGPWPYYMALKDIALEIGFDLPFYTRTGWPKLNGKEEFGKLLPLYGDYADGFWDRVLTDMPGDYKKAFIMKDNRMSTVIATETFNKDELTSSSSPRGGQEGASYPYLTCELGGGMMPAYHRRINISGREAMPLAICKLGSGSNLPGYYMYHGGTNPGPQNGHYMAETQASPVTNYNDMPVMSYDFQSPLGEMGQLNETAYHETRWLHQFLADWGEELALADVDTLSDNYARRGAFEFYNDYVRILNESGKAYVSLKDWHGITTIGVQPFAKADGKLYFIPVKGAKKFQLKVNGKTYILKQNKPISIVTSPSLGRAGVGSLGAELLSYDRAKTAFVFDGKMHYAKSGAILYKGDGGKIVQESWEPTTDITVNITQDAAKNNNVALREVKMGGQKVAAMPVDSDFENAAVYSLSIDGVTTTSLPGEGRGGVFYLKVKYQGDVARLYADGKLIEDNLWNGKPMLVRLSDIVNKKVELRILPLGKDYPIYLQKEQRDILDKAENGKLLRLEGIEIIKKTILYENDK